MSATATITFRTDPELKADVEEILEEMGINLWTALNSLIKKVRDVGGIPFALSRKSKHARIVNAYHEAQREVEAHDAKFCDDPAKLHNFLFA